MTDTINAPATEDNEHQEHGQEPGLREYVRLGEAGRQLREGSIEVASRITGWIAAGEGWQGSARRLGAIAFGGYAVLYTDYTTVLTLAGAAAWCVTAWVIEPKDETEEGSRPKVSLAKKSGSGEESPSPAGDAEDEDQEDEPEAAAAEPTLTEVAELLRAVAGDRSGVHLDDVLAAPANGLPKAWSKGDLRAALEGWGVPVREQLKLTIEGRQRNRVGVRVCDLPAPTPGPAPGPAAGAGQEPASEPSPPPAQSPTPGAPVGR